MQQTLETVKCHQLQSNEYYVPPLFFYRFILDFVDLL